MNFDFSTAPTGICLGEGGGRSICVEFLVGIVELLRAWVARFTDEKACVVIFEGAIIYILGKKRKKRWSPSFVFKCAKSWSSS